MQGTQRPPVSIISCCVCHASTPASSLMLPTTDVKPLQGVNGHAPRGSGVISEVLPFCFSGSWAEPCAAHLAAAAVA